MQLTFFIQKSLIRVVLFENNRIFQKKEMNQQKESLFRKPNNHFQSKNLADAVLEFEEIDDEYRLFSAKKQTKRRNNYPRWSQSH